VARYLVTGGCGFIGSHLVDALAGAGHAVRVVDDLSTGRRENLAEAAELVVGDAADDELVRRAAADVDGCFHLAAVASVARSTEDWLGTHRSNLTATIAVLDAARARRTPVVYASSAAVYGACPDTPLTEDSRPQPLSAYGADKLASELHAAVAHHVHGVATTGLRFFNVYGPRQDPKSPYSGVVSIFVERLAAGKALEIHGDGEQVRDFIYVDDVVRHLLAAMERAAGAAVYNVCTGRTTSVNALAQVLGGLAGVNVRVERTPARAGDIRVSLGDPTKARAALGVTATVPLRDGLAKTRAWLLGQG